MLKINWKLVFSFWATLFIPLLYLVNIYIAAIYGNTFNISLQLRFLGIILSMVGIIFWIVSYINLGKSFGVLPKKQKRVNKGLYKYFNHPMYMAIFTTFLGMSIANASWQGLIFLNIVILPILFIRAHFEDKNLT
ncbi:MAG: isoprenylcysteine carboxyl methyltransferase [uncultured bacterium]|nr:MAG: isoprenylcysteine carboxyl methyltransferase [uncultured bacterium]